MKIVIGTFLISIGIVLFSVSLFYLKEISNRNIKNSEK